MEEEHVLSRPEQVAAILVLEVPNEGPAPFLCFEDALQNEGDILRCVARGGIADQSHARQDAENSSAFSGQKNIRMLLPVEGPLVEKVEPEAAMAGREGSHGGEDGSPVSQQVD